MSGKGVPTLGLARAPRPTHGEGGVDPMAQMRMPCRPGTGYAKIIAHPRRPFIEDSSLTHRGFKPHQLLVSERVNSLDYETNGLYGLNCRAENTRFLFARNSS